MFSDEATSPDDILVSEPRRSYLAQRDEIDAAISRVLESGHYILGSETTSFEDEFAAYLGARHAVGVASGTDALQLALRACGVGPGDGVITVSHTAVATVAAVVLTGATPILLDVDPRYFTMNPDAIVEALLKERRARPKVIIPVHLYGHPAAMSEIMRIAEDHGLLVIEDCAQSHGASIGERKTGTWGHLAAFSFYPTKNLGCVGDGGAVVTNDSNLASRVRELREYGWRGQRVSESEGLNSRLDEIQAAVLRVKLRTLDRDNRRRRTIAEQYDAGFRDLPLTIPASAVGCRHVYHQYVVRTPSRDILSHRLRDDGVATAVHYPVPVHRQPGYRSISVPLALPVTEAVVEEILSLPMHSHLSPDEVNRVIESVRRNVLG